MNRRRRHLGILTGSGCLILSLTVLSQDLGSANSFPLLFVPLILLGAYLEGTFGALGTTLFSALSLAGAGFVQLLPRAAASADIFACGLTFGLSVFFILGHEGWVRSNAAVRVPREARLLKIERKARVIREQIEKYEQRLKTLTQLYDAGKKVMNILQLNTLVDEARTEMAKILPGHFLTPSDEKARLGIYLPDDQSGDFTRLRAQDHEISDEGLPQILTQKELRGWLGEDFSALPVKDVREDPRFAGLAGEHAFRSLLLIPMTMHEILIGVLLLSADRAGAFSQTDLAQLKIFSKQLVFALRKALLYRKVQTLSITDNLTGLFVHRHFQERFREELHRAERYHHALSLILLDLDHFKQVNDVHGHSIGDTVLAEAASRIKEASGPTAIVARYGGEEFAVVLPHTPKARAMQVANAINTLLKARPFDLGGLRLPLTISAGVATYPEDALAREAVIQAADTALYQAKRDGRDMVVGYTRGLHEKNN